MEDISYQVILQFVHLDQGDPLRAPILSAAYNFNSLNETMELYVKWNTMIGTEHIGRLFVACKLYIGGKVADGSYVFQELREGSPVHRPT